MTDMSIERLAEIRERANLQCGLDGDDADELLIHVDHLADEVARLRECVTEAVDYCNDMAHDYEAGYVARAVLGLLSPPTGGGGR